MKVTKLVNTVLGFNSRPSHCGAQALNDTVLTADVKWDPTGRKEGISISWN